MAEEREASPEDASTPPPAPQEGPEGAPEDPQQGSHETPVPEKPAPEEAPAEPLPQAEPGVYRCVGEIAGEHAVLGILTQGQEYDYSHADDRTLQAVAAYVELGVLEKVEGESPTEPSTAEPSSAEAGETTP